MKRMKQLTAALLSLCLLLSALPFSASALEADVQDAVLTTDTPTAPDADAASEEVPAADPAAPSEQPEADASAEEPAAGTADFAGEASDTEEEALSDQPMTAAASVFTGRCGANVTYKLDAGTGTLTISGTGAMEDYDQAGVTPWKSQSEDSRVAANNVTTLVVSSGVTHIGSYAFSDLCALTKVTLPEGLLTIGKNAFSDNGRLLTITLPSTVTELGHGAFSYSGLTSITMPKSLKKIGPYAFLSCDFTSVTVPEGVTEIGEGAFMSCLQLTSVSLPGTLLTIGDGAFIFTALTSLTLPGKLTSVGEQAFFGCAGLYAVTIPASVTTIGEMAFAYDYMDDGSGDCGVYEDFVISGVSGSTAETYARENGITFKAISTMTKLSTPALTRVDNVENGIRVSWKAVSGAASYQVYYSIDGGKTWKSPKSTAGTSYTFTNLTSGTVYNFTVRAVSGSVRSGYQKPGLSLRYLATPTLSAAANVTNGVKVRWKAVTGAVSYLVYCSTDGGKTWKTPKSAAGTSYVYSSGLTSGKDYTFTVRAVNGSVRSGYNHTGSSVYCLSAPKLLNASASGGVVHLSWTPVNGAGSYAVYSSTNGGKKWSCLGDCGYTAADGTVSADVKNVKSATTYHFTVRAVAAMPNNGMSGYYTPGLSVTTSNAPVLTRAVSVVNGVSIRWNSVPGASGYLVYYSADGGKTWKTPKSTTGTSYLYQGLTPGKQYSFTVRAVINGVRGSYDKQGISCWYLAAPAVTGASKTASGIQITWEAAAGARYYMVYRSTNGGKNWGSPSQVAGTSYTFTGLKAGTTYHFTVRAVDANGNQCGYLTPGFAFTVPD